MDFSVFMICFLLRRLQRMWKIQRQVHVYIMKMTQLLSVFPARLHKLILFYSWPNDSFWWNLKWQELVADKHIHEKKIFFVGHIKPTNFVKQTDLQPHLRAEDPRAHAKPKQTKVLTLNPIRNNAKWRKNLRKMGTAHCVHWSNQTNRLDTSSIFLNSQ